MGVEPRSRRDAERNHQTIVTAAIAVLANTPQATMADIAHASGTGRSTLYRHFPDREALIAAIYGRVMGEAEAIVTQWLPGRVDDDPVEALAGLCNSLAAIGDRYRFLEHHRAEIAAKKPGTSPQLEGAFLDYLTTHQRTGQIRADLPAEWLLSMLGAVIRQAASQRTEEERVAIIDATVRSLLGAP